MPSLNSLIRRVGEIIGFRPWYFKTRGEGSDPGDFSSHAARRSRYAVYWGLYENNVYQKVHRYANLLKTEYGLYDYIRSIYSPAYRLGEFYPNHVMGGRLDPLAGNGVDRPSAIPIVTENEALRPAIATLWRLSNWQTRVQVWTRLGAVLGDVGLRIVDDEARQAVYLEPVHPGDVREVMLDPFGNCKGYVLDELRMDPRDEADDGTGGTVLYTEECEKDGQDVVFRTYLDGDPFDWRDYPDDNSPRVGPEWSMDYGFVPFVWTPHNDVGQGSGWAEFHPILSKLHEVDHLASKLNDQIGKVVNPPWFASGVQRGDLTFTPPTPTADDPQPGRTWAPILYSTDPGARMAPLVMPLEIAAVSAHIKTILDSIEADYPELQADMDTASGDASGRALRVARQKAEAKVVARRALYDDALVRAHRMAVSIGAIRQYPGFEAFTRDSYAKGELAHSIGERPVFAIDPLDRLEEDQAQANVFKTWVDSGMPKELALRLVGWTEGQVAEFRTLAATEADAVMERERQMQALGFDAASMAGSTAAGAALP